MAKVFVRGRFFFGCEPGQATTSYIVCLYFTPETGWRHLMSGDVNIFRFLLFQAGRLLIAFQQPPSECLFLPFKNPPMPPPPPPLPSLSLSLLPPINGPRSKDPDRNPPEDLPKLLLPFPVPSVVKLFFILITPSGGGGAGDLREDWLIGGSVIELIDDAGDAEKGRSLLGNFSPPEIVAEGNRAIPGVERVLLLPLRLLRLLLLLAELLLLRSKSEDDMWIGCVG